MKKNNYFKLLIVLLVCIVCFLFYLWRYSPFLPHINRNSDESFIYNNIRYSIYSEPDFVEKFQNIERGKKIAIINKQGNLPRCTVYEATGENFNDVLIVYEEVIMSTDSYYTAK
ncbi:MAG: hypothetical protein RSD22_11560 [Romboutsia sp.]